jgi:hypothetical protein
MLINSFEEPPLKQIETVEEQNVIFAENLRLAFSEHELQAALCNLRNKVIFALDGAYKTNGSSQTIPNFGENNNTLIILDHHNDDQITNISTTMQMWNFLLSQIKNNELEPSPIFVINDADPDVTVPFLLYKYINQFAYSNKLHLLEELVKIVNWADTNNGGWIGEKISLEQRKLNSLNFRTYFECLKGNNNLESIWNCSLGNVESFFEFCIQTKETKFEKILEEYLSTHQIELKTGNNGQNVYQTSKDFCVAITIGCEPDGKHEAYLHANQNNFCPVGLFCTPVIVENQKKFMYTWNAPNPNQFETQEEYLKVRMYVTKLIESIALEENKLRNNHGLEDSQKITGGSWRSGGTGSNKLYISPQEIGAIIKHLNQACLPKN